MPFFSVIVPAYNREHLICATLRSVLGQRFTDYELIVVDDGSTDGTARVVEQFGAAVQLVRLVRNSGLCGARNAGLAAAHGEYCALLDSDDLWAPWTLECYHRAIAERRSPAIVNCDGVVGIHAEEDMTHLPEAPFAAEGFSDYLAYRCAHPEPLLLLTGMAMRTDLLREAGGFRERFRVFFEEQDLWLRLGTAAGFVRIRQPLCWGYREHPGNISKDLTRLLRGGHELVFAERQGDYPGGRSRRADRRAVITAVARYVAREALRRQHILEGWALYRETLGWNLGLGRARFVAAYPAMAGVAIAKRLVRGGSVAGVPAPAATG